MKTYSIAVMGGDGIGPEVTEETIKVIKRASDGFQLEFKEYPYGADHYLATGELLPDAAIEQLKKHDAILLGALGDPRVETGVLEQGILLRARFSMEMYVNLRPVKLYHESHCPVKGKGPADVDFLVCRENTEDAYAGKVRYENKGTPDEVAIQEAPYSWKGCERILRYGFERAQKRKRKKLTLVDKANAVKGHEIWRRVFEAVKKDYPDVEADNAFVDATCMWMVKNPEFFDVIVTSNMFGDIITDLGAMIQGGMGLAAGGNIHPGKVSMFEPIHGSAPKYKGQKKVSPIAAILSGALMLEHLGEQAAADRIENAVKKVLESGKLPSLDAKSGVSTDRQGDMVCEAL